MIEDNIPSLGNEHGPASVPFRAYREAQTRAEEESEQRAEAEARAATDALTSLPNQGAFEDFLTKEVLTAQTEALEAHRRGEDYEPTLALLVLDITDFKNANTYLLHQGANEFLRALSDWLLSIFKRQDDIVGVPGRVGGDEFSVIIHMKPRELHPDGANKTQETLLEDFQQYFEQEKDKFFETQPEKVRVLYEKKMLNLAVGISLWRPGQDALSLFNDADAKAYAQKKLQHQEAKNKRYEN
ncbi:MAG TPA: GGDEF domain-containing protein, partial [Candidatus Saccharimonadales bacterium]|nr:GGDEF domain-containing protein [Candidatus Saccharimonadales bacterium]